MRERKTNNMQLYDDIISEINDILKDITPKKIDISNKDSQWDDVGNRNMILKSEMAYELGGGSLPALSGLIVSEDRMLIPDDEVLLYGPDLHDIEKDSPYARIALIRVNKGELGEGDSLYNAIKKLDYAKYHINPKGFMMRISTSSHKEQARVGRKALEEGLSISKIANMFNKEYHKSSKIEAVKQIYITQPDFPYSELESKIKKIDQITSTIEHIFKNVVMDCNACNQKEVCDEIEGMRQLHFERGKGLEEGNYTGHSS